MPLPEFGKEGYLPEGIHAATLAEVGERFGSGSEGRERQAELLRLVVEAAKAYPTIKRILVWGSFVTSKPEPNDLDYSVIVSNRHGETNILNEHRRFFLQFDARMHYGVDPGYLIIADYPLMRYVESLDFLCRTRLLHPRGIVEIGIRGEEGATSP